MVTIDKLERWKRLYSMYESCVVGWEWYYILLYSLFFGVRLTV